MITPTVKGRLELMISEDVCKRGQSGYKHYILCHLGIVSAAEATSAISVHAGEIGCGGVATGCWSAQVVSFWKYHHYEAPGGAVTTDLWWWPHRCHTGQAPWRCCSWWLVCSSWSCLCRLSVSSRSCSNHTRVCSKYNFDYFSYTSSRLDVYVYTSRSKSWKFSQEY